MEDRWKDAVILSVNQDLKQLDRLMKEISVQVSHSEVASWLFPTKTQTDVKDVDTTNTSYTTCLELLLDRIYVTINFFLVYLDEQFPESRGNIRKPKRLTLGVSLEYLWRKLNTFQNQADFNKQNEKAVQSRENVDFISTIPPRFDKDVQTDKSTLATCDSCAVALTSVKRIASILDTNVVDSKTKLSREKIRLNIFDITSFGSMLDLSASIENDIEALIKTNERLFEVSQRTTRDLEIAKRAHEVLMNKFLLTESNYEQLVIQHDKCKSENDALILYQNELLQTKEEHKLKLVSQDNTINAVQNALSNLQSYHKTVSTALADSTERNKQMEMQCTLLHENIVTMCKKLDSLTNNIDIFLEILDQRVSLFDKRICACNLFLVQVQEAIRSGGIKQESLIASLKNELINSGSCQVKKSSVAGNPLDDMMHQITVNEESMNKLREENDSLMKTVNKLKKIRRS